MSSKKSISVGLPPGLGDIHWVLTKLESFKNKNAINELEVVVYEDYRHSNSKDFLRMIPFIDKVSTIEHELNFDFIKDADQRISFKKDCNDLDYLIEFNSPLEMGIPIEAILPEYDIDFDYPIDIDTRAQEIVKEVKNKVGNKLILMYCSSSTMAQAWTGDKWTPNDWVRTARCIQECTQCQVVLIGKEWDHDYACEVIQADVSNVFYNMIGQTSIAQTLALIKNAAAFVGFPSGLTILSTKFKTPVVMFWSIKGVTPSGYFIKEFMNCWVEPEVLRAGIYLPFAFGDSSTTPTKVFKSLERFLK